MSLAGKDALTLELARTVMASGFPLSETVLKDPVFQTGKPFVLRAISAAPIMTANHDYNGAINLLGSAFSVPLNANDPNTPSLQFALRLLMIVALGSTELTDPAAHYETEATRLYRETRNYTVPADMIEQLQTVMATFYPQLFDTAYPNAPATAAGLLDYATNNRRILDLVKQNKMADALGVARATENSPYLAEKPSARISSQALHIAILGRLYKTKHDPALKAEADKLLHAIEATQGAKPSEKLNASGLYDQMFGG
jgi:hypothetical protein